MIVVQPAWWEDARRIAGLPQYSHAHDRERLVKGFLAERAVIAALLELDDRAVTWLSGEPASRQYSHLPFRRRPHVGDIRWGEHELDVKLIGRRHEHLVIKSGAQHMHHVFVQWLRHGESLELLGVLLANQPETFEPARQLEGFTHLTNGDRAVHGWSVPRARLQPLATLLQLQETT